MAGSAYRFGDSRQAATRLALLAEIFEQTTRSFLDRLGAGHGRHLAVDLGCGPGSTTALVREVLAPVRLVGVDSSAPFVDDAASRLGSGVEVILADVAALPPRLDGVDLFFARFLLTHLTAPIAALRHWLGRLSPAGVVAVEEVESITTDDPVLARYLELQRRMLEANGNRLEIGPAIESAADAHGEVVGDDVASLTPSASAAARMFAMNFASWRTRPEVAHLAGPTELDEIAAGLDQLAAAGDSQVSITWQLRQLTIAVP